MTEQVIHTLERLVAETHDGETVALERVDALEKELADARRALRLVATGADEGNEATLTEEEFHFALTAFATSCAALCHIPAYLVVSYGEQVGAAFSGNIATADGIETVLNAALERLRSEWDQVQQQCDRARNSGSKHD